MNNFHRPKSGFSDRCGGIPTGGPHSLIKMRLEDEMVRRRESEARRAETARSHDRYFQHWNVQNEKFDDWTSPKSARLSSRQARLLETEAEVEERRSRLKNLYEEDRRKEEQALKKLEEEEERKKVEGMKDRVQRFRSAKSAKHAELVERSEHERWKASSASYRAFESELKTQQQREVWERQLREKEEDRIRQAEEKKAEAAEAERIAREEEARLEMERSRLYDQKRRWKGELDEQMALLKSKDTEADEKRREYDRLMAEGLALEAVKEEMQRKEDERARQRKNAEFLTKQHLARLRQRSREVAAELEAEMNQARKLFPSEQLGEQDQKNKEQHRQEMVRYLQLVQQHRQLEKERIEQTEFLFQEEAKRMWDKREKEWEMERQARRKLMEDVIATQQRQVEEKIRSARLEREQLLRDREEIAAFLKHYEEELKSQEVDSRVKQMQAKSDLLAQMEARKEQRAQEASREERDRRLQEQLEAAREEKHWAIAMDQLKL